MKNISDIRAVGYQIINLPKKLKLNQIFCSISIAPEMEFTGSVDNVSFPFVSFSLNFLPDRGRRIGSGGGSGFRCGLAGDDRQGGEEE